jgi:DNA-directed RNA polymerase specialized sigma24 family protein
MKSHELHLIDVNGNAVSPSIRDAVEEAYRWALVECPQADPAIIANIAERLAKSMAEKADSLRSERRYAYEVMHRKVRQWLRSRAARELAVGLGGELEKRAGVNDSFQTAVNREILFQQLKARLSDRDRHILVLLQRNASPIDVAVSLGINYGAAAKAIQRVRERVAACLNAAQSKEDSSRQISSTKDLIKKWI